MCIQKVYLHPQENDIVAKIEANITQMAKYDQIRTMLEYYTTKYRQIQVKMYIFPIFVNYAYFYVNMIM